MERRGAFTLIELLVVIAIIAILAAILFPVFAQARASAIAGACLSNSRQIAQATLMYANDHDERIYPGGYILEGAGYYEYHDWSHAFRVERGRQNDIEGGGFLQPYLKNYQIQDCGASREIFYFSQAQPFAYAINRELRPPAPGGPWHTHPVSLAEVSHPAETILGADAAGVFSQNGIFLFRAERLMPPSFPLSNEAPCVHGRHRGRANVTWLDGHAKSQPIAYRPGDLNTLNTADYRRSQQIGDLVHPDYPIGSPNQDYYFVVRKP